MAYFHKSRVHVRLEWRLRWHIIGSRGCGTHMKRLECQLRSLASILRTMGSHGGLKQGRTWSEMTFAKMLPQRRWVGWESLPRGRGRREGHVGLKKSEGSPPHTPVPSQCHCHYKNSDRVEGQGGSSCPGGPRLHTLPVTRLLKPEMTQA